ncbi:MAG: hypothetical protein MHM6MM_002146 [Cercozoa sp. M6MM]
MKLLELKGGSRAVEPTSTVVKKARANVNYDENLKISRRLRRLCTDKIGEKTPDSALADITALEATIASAVSSAPSYKTLVKQTLRALEQGRSVAKIAVRIAVRHRVPVRKEFQEEYARHMKKDAWNRACLTAKQRQDNSYPNTGVEAPANARALRVLAMDCEMVETTKDDGALARVSVVDEHCSVVLDMLVLPPDSVVDWRTDKSGLTAEKMSGVTACLEDAQRALFEHMSPSTILVGHSLENDLRSLQVKHVRVCDTAILYAVAPKTLTRRNLGRIRKRKLRDLARELLNMDIQEHGDTDGHDSVEDAQAAMRLALHYVQSQQQPGEKRRQVEKREGRDDSAMLSLDFLRQSSQQRQQILGLDVCPESSSDSDDSDDEALLQVSSPGRKRRRLAPARLEPLQRRLIGIDDAGDLVGTSSIKEGSAELDTQSQTDPVRPSPVLDASKASFSACKAAVQGVDSNAASMNDISEVDGLNPNDFGAQLDALSAFFAG